MLVKQYCTLLKVRATELKAPGIIERGKINKIVLLLGGQKKVTVTSYLNTVLVLVQGLLLFKRDVKNRLQLKTITG
jgi:hypothetical protein